MGLRLAIAVLVGAGTLVQGGYRDVGLHIWIARLQCFFVMVVAVKEIKRISWPKTVALTLLGFAADGVVQFVFIR